MPNGQDHTPSYTVTARGIKIKCESFEQVVNAVHLLEREVPVAQASEPLSPAPTANPIALAVYDLFREEARWRRPVEIVKTLRKRGRREASYNRVYAVLRYGDFVQRGGRWNLTDAA